MTLNLLIAPDFSPERFAGWHMLNTALQKKSGLALHLLMPTSAKEQADMIAAEQADVVYANPFDAAELINSHGYRALARPIGKSDEMVIATADGSPMQSVEDFKPGQKIALTDNKDVKLIGLRLIEPADVTEADLNWTVTDTYQAAARMAIKGEVDAAFFLAEAYHSLSKLTRSQLRPLMESALSDIQHVVLGHSRAADKLPVFSKALLEISATPEGQAVLDELGIPKGFEPMNDEDAAFMIDLMDTLLD